MSFDGKKTGKRTKNTKHFGLKDLLSTEIWAGNFFERHVHQKLSESSTDVFVELKLNVYPSFSFFKVK